MVSDVHEDPDERAKALSIGFIGLTTGLIIGFPYGSLLFEFVGKLF